MEKDPEKKTSKGSNVLKYSGMTFQIAAYIGVGVFIGNKLLAKGEITVENEKIAVRVSNLYGSKERFKHL